MIDIEAGIMMLFRTGAGIVGSADDLKTAVAVKDRFDWHRVVKVNAKTVSVETGYSWLDRIAVEDMSAAAVAAAVAAMRALAVEDTHEHPKTDEDYVRAILAAVTPSLFDLTGTEATT